MSQEKQVFFMLIGALLYVAYRKFKDTDKTDKNGLLKS